MLTKFYHEGKDYVQMDIGKLRARLEKTAPLLTFAYQKAAPGEQWISISTPELTCICPFSDFPDFGSVEIRYLPRQRCLELKSFKLYIVALRDVKIFHEAVTELIFADFLRAVAPKKAWIVVDMNARGNVKTVCRKYWKITPVTS